MNDKENVLVLKRGDPDYRCNEFCGKLTDQLDEFLIEGCKNALEKYLGYGTYVVKNDLDNSFYIRYPGATRGYAFVDMDGVIQSVEMHHGSCFGDVGCYERSRKDELLSLVKSYVGKKVVFIDETKCSKD